MKNVLIASFLILSLNACQTTKERVCEDISPEELSKRFYGVELTQVIRDLSGAEPKFKYGNCKGCIASGNKGTFGSHGMAMAIGHKSITGKAPKISMWDPAYSKTITKRLYKVKTNSDGSYQWCE